MAGYSEIEAAMDHAENLSRGEIAYLRKMIKRDKAKKKLLKKAK